MKNNQIHNLDNLWLDQAEWEKNNKNPRKFEKGGMEDDPMPLPCNHPSHNVPTHLYIPPGKIYTHICPHCGYKVVLRPPRITC